MKNRKRLQSSSEKRLPQEGRNIQEVISSRRLQLITQHRLGTNAESKPLISAGLSEREHHGHQNDKQNMKTKDIQIAIDSLQMKLSNPSLTALHLAKSNPCLL